MHLTPTLSQFGETTIDSSCTALTDLHRSFAQDTGHDPFMSAKAAAARARSRSTSSYRPRLARRSITPSSA